MNNCYLQGASLETTIGWVNGAVVNLNKLKSANVLVALEKGGYLLVDVKPPNRVCTVYLSDKDEIVYADVAQIFTVAQNNLSWCEFY